MRVASYIDHTALKSTTTPAQIDTLCEEALTHGFAAVCVNGDFVRQVAARLQGSQVKTCAVVGFPLGCGASSAKAAETRQCVADGAQEIDMVINVGRLQAGQTEEVQRDIACVVEAAGSAAHVKVIIECCLLTDEQNVQACKLAVAAGAHYVKTSTGFSSGGATVDDVRLMRASVPDSVGVKAAGGIRDLATARAMIEAGATRIGASAGVAIVGEE